MTALALALAAAVAVAVIAAGLTMAGSAGASVPTGKKPGGSITVYSGRNETLIKALFDQFTADTGITVEARYGDSGALAGQLLTEADATPADVFVSQDAGALGALSKEELFAKLPAKARALVPAEYQADDGTWIGTSGRVRVLVYNPTLVPKPPTTIDELIKPEWKGKLGFAPTNASWQAFVTALRVDRGEVRAEKWLRGFAANEPKAYANNGAVRDAVNAGQISIGLVNHYYLWQALRERPEAPAKNFFMPAGDVSSFVNVAGVALLSDDPAAARLVEYLLGEAAQRYFAEETFEYPLAAGVSPPVALPPLESLPLARVDFAALSENLEPTLQSIEKSGLLQ
jgi:iron(III) transport system substrate-binding protein